LEQEKFLNGDYDINWLEDYQNNKERP